MTLSIFSDNLIIRIVYQKVIPPEQMEHPTFYCKANTLLVLWLKDIDESTIVIAVSALTSAI